MFNTLEGTTGSNISKDAYKELPPLFCSHFLVLCSTISVINSRNVIEMIAIMDGSVTLSFQALWFTDAKQLLARSVTLQLVPL